MEDLAVGHAVDTGIVIRADTDADFEALYQLDQECYEPEIAYSRRELRAYLHEPGAICRVAEVIPPTSEGAIAGFVIAQKFGRKGHIITLDVRKVLRRRGVGSRLLRDAEERLEAAGVREVALETAVDNAPAVAFWKKHAYVSCGVLSGYYNGARDAYLMIKILPYACRPRS